MSQYRENKTRLHKEIQEGLKVFPIKVLVEKKGSQMLVKVLQTNINVKYIERVFNELANGAPNYEALLPMNLVKQ